MQRFPTSWRHTLLGLFIVLIGTCFLFVGAVLMLVAFTPAPDASSFAAREESQSTKIYDRTGQVLLYDYNRDARREVVKIGDISPSMVNAAIAIEDASFFNHGGIRITSIIRAMLADVLGGSLAQGGSTITQQVVKNTLLTSKKSVVRKLHEWVLAIKLEEVYSKEQILETYLNNIPLGGTLYGVEAAAETYFGTTAHDLTVAQSAYLAAMIQAPSYYSPTGTHRAELETRKNVVLSRMHELGFITDDTYAKAQVEKVSFTRSAQNAIVAPHFVFYILNQLEQQFGTTALASGLKVITTLDVDLQTKAEDTVARYANENEKKFNASNAALIALDPQTGQILSMVGSRSYFDTTIDGQYNASLALRQPGSTMKPFVYSLALDRGFTRDTIVFDVPTQFSTACQPNEVQKNKSPCYAPENYDGKFRGPMTFETALAQSINIPAIKVLYMVGIQNAINRAKDFGLTSLGDPNQYGLTLVLGGGEVRLLDLVGAYSAFGNDGVLNQPTGILEVTDAKGTILANYSPSPTRVISENTARDISGMLSDAQARLPEYPLNSPLSYPGYDVAVKTGTTNDTRDAWVVGYSPSIAVGVWAGNNDNTPMVKSIAGFIAAPMWHEVLAYALTKYPKTYFTEPAPISPLVPPLLQGNWHTPDAIGALTAHSELYWFDKTNPRGPSPLGATNDPQYPYWEYGVTSWAASHPELFLGNIMLPVPLGAS